MKFTYKNVGVLLLISFFLSGCLYPKDELTKNKIPYPDQLDMVQAAVERYSELTDGLMPIKTSESDTPIFEKHLIDFNALKQKSVLSSIPGNAFENGGIYQYTIITPDDNPRVKLIDLQTAEVLRKVNIKLDRYRSKKIYPPYGKEVEKGIFYIDYNKIGFKNEQYVTSPFSKENLPIVMDVEGKLYIDYRIDLQRVLGEENPKVEAGDDIRYILTENSPFVPAYSLPYTVSADGEPIFLIDDK